MNDDPMTEQEVVKIKREALELSKKFEEASKGYSNEALLSVCLSVAASYCAKLGDSGPILVMLSDLISEAFNINNESPSIEDVANKLISGIEVQSREL